MIAFLLTLLLAMQGIPTPPGLGGTITGTLKMADGSPAAGVRVAAALRPDSALDAVSAGALISIAETDANGHFQLENIPQGRYLITAGRVDLPTYYPGTTDADKGKVVLITAGAIISAIDFVLDPPSVRNDSLYGYLGRLTASALTVYVPLDVKVDGGGKLPVFAGGKFTTIWLTPKAGSNTGVQTILNSVSVEAPVPAAGVHEFQVTVHDLPDGYIVKSLTYGSTDLKTGTLKLSASASAANASSLAGLSAALAAIANTSPAPPLPPLPVPVPVAANSSTAPPLPVMTLTIVLATAPLLKPSTSGVRIAGRTSDTGPRSVYISGTPGNFYSDGSFEFLGVPAGLQTILLTDPGSVYGTPGRGTVLAGRMVAVADQNIENVGLEDITLLPPDPRTLSLPGPPTNRAPGPIPLATLRGRILEESEKTPVAGGTVTIVGGSRQTYRIDADGRFQIPGLFPGTYKIEVGNFGHTTVRETVVIEEDDVDLDLTAIKL